MFSFTGALANMPRVIFVPVLYPNKWFRGLLMRFLVVILFPFNGAYAVEDASLVITHGTILTMNKDKTIIHDGVVVVQGNKITAVGDQSLEAQYRSKLTLDVGGDIVMPGLINAHTHLSMTVFRTLGEDITNRLHRYIFPLESQFVDEEMVRIGAQLGALEHIKGGTTTLADMYYFEQEVAKVIDKIGLRAVLGATILSGKTPDAANPEEAIKNTLEFIDNYQNHPRITPAFAPHGPYTNDTKTLQKITRLSKRMEVPVLIHLAESDREVAVIKERSGLSPVAYMEQIGALTRFLTAAHLLRVNDEDILMLQAADVGIAHNMSANIKSAKGVAPAIAMFKQGLRIGLGTDGPMSGNTLSIVDELGQVAKLHKLVNKDRTAMPAVDVVTMATMGGARALHLEQVIGSLEAGKLADMVVIDTKSPNMVPIYDVYAALVYSAYATNVRHSIVNGKLLMRNRKVLSVSETSLVDEAIKYSKRIKDSL